jgi:hypothetical protein
MIIRTRTGGNESGGALNGPDEAPTKDVSFKFKIYGLRHNLPAHQYRHAGAEQPDIIYSHTGHKQYAF